MLISIPFKSHDIHVFYVSMHGKAREYKEDVKNYNDSRKQKGKEVIRKPISVEMNNFQDPQVRKKTAGAFSFLLICMVFLFLYIQMSSPQPLVLIIIRLFVHSLCLPFLSLFRI